VSCQVIFEPIEPTYVCGVKLHGLFLQRQREVRRPIRSLSLSLTATVQVSAVYGRLAGTEVLTAKRLVAAIVNGSSVGGSDTFREIIRRHFDLSFDEVGSQPACCALTCLSRHHCRHRCRQILQSSIVTSLGSKLVLSEKV
jgi:hypothetical protein